MTKPQFLQLFLILILVSCRQIKTENVVSKLVAINYNDSIFKYRSNYDTTLLSNWAITYLVKNDSTKYKDIYLKVKKQNDSSIYFLEDYLYFRDYFTPTYSNENDKFIFFEHGCATSCRAVLVFDKTTLKFTDFTQIIDYCVKTNKIVWVSNQELNDDQPFKVKIKNLLKSKDTTISFNNLALGTIKDSYIDSVNFKNKIITIYTTLIDKNDYYRTKEIKETKVIRY